MNQDNQQPRLPDNWREDENLRKWVFELQIAMFESLHRIKTLNEPEYHLVPNQRQAFLLTMDIIDFLTKDNHERI